MSLNTTHPTSTVRYGMARHGLFRALFSGLRAALLLPARPDLQPVRPSHVLLLWLLTLLVSAMGDAILLGLSLPLLNESSPIEPVPNLAGIRGAALEPLLWLLASLWIATPSAGALRAVAGAGVVAMPAPLQLAAPLFAANLWITLAGYAFIVAAERGVLSHLEPLQHLDSEQAAELAFLVAMVWPVAVALVVMLRIWKHTHARPGSWLVLPFLALVAWISLQFPPEPMWRIDDEDANSQQEQVQPTLHLMAASPPARQAGR